MDANHLTKRVMSGNVDGRALRERQKFSWMNDVKSTLNIGILSVERARVRTRNMNE